MAVDDITFFFPWNFLQEEKLYVRREVLSISFLKKIGKK